MIFSYKCQVKSYRYGLLATETEVVFSIEGKQVWCGGKWIYSQLIGDSVFGFWDHIFGEHRVRGAQKSSGPEGPHLEV